MKSTHEAHRLLSKDPETEPCLLSVTEKLTDEESKIVFNRYHIMTHRLKAVDVTRKKSTAS